MKRHSRESSDDDPFSSTRDFFFGDNNSCLNPDSAKLFGKALIERVNKFNTRMMRLCYLVEQEPQDTNKITLSSSFVDGLGLPRPEVNYSVTGSEYTLRGIVAARLLGSGTFPTITTANPTLTIAALTFRASRAVLKDLAM